MKHNEQNRAKEKLHTVRMRAAATNSGHHLFVCSAIIIIIVIAYAGL